MVDNVLDMCYSQIDSQVSAHWAFAPVRLLWSQSLRSATDAANSADGPAIHWFADKTDCGTRENCRSVNGLNQAGRKTSLPIELDTVAKVVMPNRL